MVNRYSQEFPPWAATREARLKTIVPAVPPGIVMTIGFVVFVPLLAGLIVTVLVAQIRPVVRFVRSREGLLAGRLLLVAVTAVLLVGTVADLRDIVDRDVATAPG